MTRRELVLWITALFMLWVVFIGGLAVIRLRTGLCRPCFNEGKKTKLYRFDYTHDWVCSRHRDGNFDNNVKEEK